MRRKDKPYGSSLKSQVDALFSRTPTSEPTNQQSLPIHSITLPDSQPRQYFDPDSLTQLADTIAAHGILEPLLVRKVDEQCYELIAGGRRYRAAQKVGLSEVPVVVLQLTDEEALELALLENLAREDLNPIEETEGILRLLETKLKSERQEVLSLLYRMRNEVKGASSRNVSASQEAEVVEELFTPLGLSWKSFVETRLPLLKLPEEVLEVLRQGQIAYTKARVIAKLSELEHRRTLLAEAITSNLSLSQIKERIQAFSSSTSTSPSLPSPLARIEATTRRLRAAKLWENPQQWQQAMVLLEKLEVLMTEAEKAEKEEKKGD